MKIDNENKSSDAPEAPEPELKLDDAVSEKMEEPEEKKPADIDVKAEAEVDADADADADVEAPGLDIGWEDSDGLENGDEIMLGDMPTEFSFEYNTASDTQYVVTDPSTEEPSQIVFKVGEDDTAIVTQINGAPVTAIEQDATTGVNHYFTDDGAYSLTSAGLVESGRVLGDKPASEWGDATELPEDEQVPEAMEVGAEDGVGEVVLEGAAEDGAGEMVLEGAAEIAFPEAVAAVAVVVGGYKLATAVANTFADANLTEQEQRDVNDIEVELDVLESLIETHVKQGPPEDAAAAEQWITELGGLVDEAKQKVQEATTIAAGNSLDTTALDAMETTLTDLLTSRPGGTGTATVGDLLTADRMKDSLEATLFQKGIPATVHVSVNNGYPGAAPTYSFQVTLPGSVGDLPAGRQSRLHEIIRNGISNTFAGQGLDASVNGGTFAVSDNAGAVKPAPAAAAPDDADMADAPDSDEEMEDVAAPAAGAAAPVGPVPDDPEEALEENLEDVDAGIAAIRAIDSGLVNGGTPPGYNTREEAVSARATLATNLGETLDEGERLLGHMPPDSTLEEDNIDAYQLAAGLIGGHSIVTHPLLNPPNELQEEFQEAGYEAGTDFNILAVMTEPNCHTYTFVASGILEPGVSTKDQVDDPSALLDQNFDRVAEFSVSTSTDAAALEAQLRAAGVQDGDVFAFTTTNQSGEAIEHTGIVRVAADGTIRLESVFGMGKPLVETAPIVTLNEYHETIEADSSTTGTHVENVVIFRKKNNGGDNGDNA